MPNQNCPICESPANYELKDYGRFKYFVCPKCKSFVMNTSTENLVVTSPKEFRDDLSKQSSAVTQDLILFIGFDNQGNLIRDEQPEGKWS